MESFGLGTPLAKVREKGDTETFCRLHPPKLTPETVPPHQKFGELLMRMMHRGFRFW